MSQEYEVWFFITEELSMKKEIISSPATQYQLAEKEGITEQENRNNKAIMIFRIIYVRPFKIVCLVES